MLTCNRVGIEGTTKFIGTSNIMRFDEKVSLILKASRNEEDIIVKELKFE